ncbi:hypothetical protein MKZ38_007776 [Zalerion maritima]|uniref:Uncharacterized protein n=1 Tax=Zalerion maritima TaxID=339359 RepID=A0AAD5RWR4_9PEZI|nr:hypothetical protein MKZ38_007776 [Zalerion maritima]
MAPKKSSSRKGSSPEVNYHHATRGGSFDAARSRLPPNINWEKLTPEKQKNCERAFTAASRRSDRDIDARYQSALTASDMHFLRTSKYLRVTRNMVMNEEMYEEEDNHPRLWTSNLRQDSDPRMAALNQQYQKIDMQFQAAFPGFGSTRGMGLSPIMGSMPFGPHGGAPNPQFDAAQYGNQSGFAPQSYAPLSYKSEENSPSPMTDSASASPMAGIATPSPSQIGGYPLPSNASSDMMTLPDNVAYTNAKFDPAYNFVGDASMFDGMTTDGTAVSWGGDEFSEFVNY